MTNYVVTELSEKIIDGIRAGNLPKGTGLNIKRYLRTDGDDTLSSCVVYIEEWDEEKTSCRFRGACCGYSGGSVYDGSFFLIDFEEDEYQVLDFSEAEEDEQAELFNALMFECARMYKEDDGVYQLTKYGKGLIKNGVDSDDGEGDVVYMDEGFDGDSLDQVSENWAISLRFES
jgi:hypothetical protein